MIINYIVEISLNLAMIINIIYYEDLYNRSRSTRLIRIWNVCKIVPTHIEKLTCYFESIGIRIARHYPLWVYDYKCIIIILCVSIRDGVE